MSMQQDLIEKIDSLPLTSRRQALDFVEWLAEREARKLKEKHEIAAEIAAFAEQFAGTEFDLDPAMEAAGGRVG